MHGYSMPFAGATEPREASPVPAAPSAGEAVPYLEEEGKSCNGEGVENGEHGVVLEEALILARCSCRGAYCPHCGEKEGYKVRKRLFPEAEKFKRPFLVTLTTDQEVFPAGPESAYRYIRDVRAVARMVKALHAAGYLNSRRYFCVLEWQKNGWAHWHLLLDAERIPFDDLAAAWNKFLPPDRPAGTGERVGLGSVRFTAPKVRTVKHAVRYITKYLTKFPAEGFPDWVLDFQGNIPRYTASRGFWEEETRQRQERQEKRNLVECCQYFDAVGAGEEWFDDAGEAVEVAQVEKHEARTIRERTARCGVGAVVLRRRVVADHRRKSGKRVEYQFFGAANAAYEECLELYGLEEVEGECVRLEEYEAKRITAVEAGSAEEYWSRR